MSNPNDQSSASAGTTKATTVSSDAYAIAKEVLELNGFLTHERIDPIDFPDVKAYVDSIMKRKRTSVLADDIVESLESDGFRDNINSANEDLFIDLFWSQILHISREPNSLGTSLDPAEQAQISKRLWGNDHLTNSRNQDSLQSSVSDLPETSGELAKIFKKVPKIKRPRPDHAYGFDKTAFSNNERMVNMAMKDIACLVQKPAVWHVFFVSEWKSNNGSLGEAALQVSRSGSAVLNAMHRLREKAGSPMRQDHDYDLDVAFSLTTDPNIANLRSHWYDSETKKHHMAKFGSYVIGRGQDMTKLHRDIDNIMDWGCNTRLRTVKWLLGKIAEIENAAAQSGQT